MWSPVPGAARYVVEVAQDAEFLVEPRRHSVTAPALAASALAAGALWWRVPAVNAAGF